MPATLSVIDSHTAGEPTRLVVEGEIVPTITGRAYVTAESVLRRDPDDPFRWGIVPG